MRVSVRWKLPSLLALALFASGVRQRARPFPLPARRQQRRARCPPRRTLRRGSAPTSLLEIRVYRAGALASAGHNHIIASHDLTGTVYVPADRAARRASRCTCRSRR